MNRTNPDKPEGQPVLISPLTQRQGHGVTWLLGGYSWPAGVRLTVNGGAAALATAHELGTDWTVFEPVWSDARPICAMGESGMRLLRTTEVPVNPGERLYAAHEGLVSTIPGGPLLGVVRGSVGPAGGLIEVAPAP